MYLTGKIYHCGCYDNPKATAKIDGFPVKEISVEVGYWRKHPNLHGYIVNTFADGKDECQEIELSIDELNQILVAVEKDELPKTEGFFFGVSRDEDKQPSIEILKKAIEWASAKDTKTESGQTTFRSIHYHGSW